MCPVSLRSGWSGDNVVTVMRSCPKLHISSVYSLCRVFSFYSLMSEVDAAHPQVVSCVSLCLVLMWQSGMAWNMLHGIWAAKTDICFSIEGLSDFFKRLLGVSSIKDSTQLFWPGCSVATFVCPSSRWRQKVIVYRSFIGLYMSFLCGHWWGWSICLQLQWIYGRVEWT